MIKDKKMAKIKVAKFGGTSMADAKAMLRSASVVNTHQANLTVVSATSGTTNKLEELMALAQGNSFENLEKTIEELREKHLNICIEIQADKIITDRVDQLCRELLTLAKGIYFLKECTPKAKDRIYSIGERLSSTIFTECLQQVLGPTVTVSFIDARDFLITDSNFNKAKPLTDEIKNRCQILKDTLETNSSQYYVTQGFIGKTIEGETTTLGRGGSDYSASIFGEAINATEIQIWTDVAGIATTDPRICPNAKIIHEITFKEAAEMAIFGAKILHPTTLVPARRSSIPVFVGSSYEPDAPGTWIKETSENKPLVRGITKKDNQTLITISNPSMAHAHGFLALIFKVFEAYDISVDAITTSEISVAMTVENRVSQNASFIQELESLGKIKLEENYSLVSLIGNKINTTPGIANKIFQGIGDTNVRMICQGASVHNFCVLVRQENGNQAVQQLHRAFID